MIECACGKRYADASSLEKRGWMCDALGGAMLLVQCECRSTIVAEVREDAAVCEICRRLVTGDTESGDFKVCAEAPCLKCHGYNQDCECRAPTYAPPMRILCRGCARREGVGVRTGLTLPNRYQPEVRT